MRSPFQGGPEKRFHARSLVEAEVARGRLGDLTASDVDSVTCFGSLKWTAIREAYASSSRHAPEGTLVHSTRQHGPPPSGQFSIFRSRRWTKRAKRLP